MSIDFATLQGLTIPEGNVTQITDASGRVLWSAVKPVTITIKASGSLAYVVINGVQYNVTTTLEVPVGTVITCVTDWAGYAVDSLIKVNYQNVAVGVKATYDYTVVSDATITLSSNLVSAATTYHYGHIEIVDANAPNGATVSIVQSGPTGGGGSGGITIDGRRYSAPINTGVPLGTVIACEAGWTSHQMYGSYGGIIGLNGNTVADRVSGVNPTRYEYTVNNDVVITINNVGSPSGVVSNIDITEIPQGNVALTITGVGHKNYCYIDVNGEKIVSSKAFGVSIGTQITVFVKDIYGSNGRIFLNGSEILRDVDGIGVSYDYTINGGVTIQMVCGNAWGDIYITEL